jgi:cytochrome d ubiquinol oxidase subunit II
MSAESAPLLAHAIAAIVVVSLVAYVLLGGADFGGGVWDLLAGGPRRARQRALVQHAIGPIWEANHVWLILVVVLLFVCFPGAFARLATVLHIPLTLMLIGIVLRGSAFTFRAYDIAGETTQKRWGRVFAIASLLTPLLLGMCVGAIASGRVGAVRVDGSMSFGEVYVDPWLTPFTVAVGLLTVVAFAFLAATYLTLEAADDALREDFRRRALASAALLFVAAFGALFLAPGHAPRVAAALLDGSAAAVALHVATGLAALAAIGALWTRRYALARLAAGAQMTGIVTGWALATWPYLVPESHTVTGSAAPAAVLRAVLVALGVGAVVLVPSLAYLFRVFKGADAASRSAHDAEHEAHPLNR